MSRIMDGLEANAQTGIVKMILWCVIVCNLQQFYNRNIEWYLFCIIMYLFDLYLFFILLFLNLFLGMAFALSR